MITSPDTALEEFADTLVTQPPDSELVSGLPADREARIAARKAFVEMKQLFMRAVQPLDDRKGQWLRYQVRLASDPMDLWLLRGPVLAAVRQDDAGNRQLRAELYRSLDSIFPQAFGTESGASRAGPPSGLPQAWAIRAAEAASAALGAA